MTQELNIDTAEVFNGKRFGRWLPCNVSGGAARDGAASVTGGLNMLFVKII